tara:strand:- start:2490 stop:3044 length:555 start_codon:yes stop_codon:yes gene_type:complete
MLNKKSQVLVYGLIAAVIAIIIFSYIGDVQPKKDFSIIGDSSLILLEISKEAEKTLFYIDQSAKYSTHQTIYDLAQNGGFADEKECGAYLGYSLWSSDSKVITECNPDFKENFKTTFKKNLNEFFPNYPQENIPINNYNLQLKDKLSVIGLATENIKIPIGDFSSDTVYENTANLDKIKETKLE